MVSARWERLSPTSACCATRRIRTGCTGGRRAAGARTAELRARAGVGGRVRAHAAGARRAARRRCSRPRRSPARATSPGSPSGSGLRATDELPANRELSLAVSARAADARLHLRRRRGRGGRGRRGGRGARRASRAATRSCCSPRTNGCGAPARGSRACCPRAGPLLAQDVRRAGGTARGALSRRRGARSCSGCRACGKVWTSRARRWRCSWSRSCPSPCPTIRSSRRARSGCASADWMRSAPTPLPEAVMRFRQGVGRLIRRSDDRGVLVVCDPRLAHASYRAPFLAALPVAPEALA